MFDTHVPIGSGWDGMRGRQAGMRMCEREHPLLVMPCHPPLVFSRNILIYEFNLTLPLKLRELLKIYVHLYTPLPPVLVENYTISPHSHLKPCHRRRRVLLPSLSCSITGDSVLSPCSLLLSCNTTIHSL